MFKGFSQLLLPIILMVCVLAVLSGLNPTTGEFTSDRSYLDAKTPEIEVPLIAVIAVVALCLFAIGGIHRTAEDNGHGGASNNLWTVIFLGVFALALVGIFGGAP